MVQCHNSDIYYSDQRNCATEIFPRPAYTSMVPNGRLHVFAETKIFFTGAHMHEHKINSQKICILFFVRARLVVLSFEIEIEIFFK